MLLIPSFLRTPLLFHIADKRPTSLNCTFAHYTIFDIFTSRGNRFCFFYNIHFYITRYNKEKKFIHPFTPKKTNLFCENSSIKHTAPFLPSILPLKKLTSLMVSFFIKLLQQSATHQMYSVGYYDSLSNDNDWNQQSIRTTVIRRIYQTRADLNVARHRYGVVSMPHSTTFVRFYLTCSKCKVRIYPSLVSTGS